MIDSHKATRKGGFFSAPATNRQINLEATASFRMVDGLIVESWGSWPIYDMLKSAEE